jgi:hypothetical protein
MIAPAGAAGVIRIRSAGLTPDRRRDAPGGGRYLPDLFVVRGTTPKAFGRRPAR